jgi:hypothetical protein
MVNDQMIHHANSAALARGGPMTTCEQARKSGSQFTGWEVIVPVAIETSPRLKLNLESQAQPAIIQRSMGSHLRRSRSASSLKLKSKGTSKSRLKA